MNANGKFKIDASEEFPHLSQAPIIEAVVDIRALAEAPWDEQQIRKRLTEELPEYPTFESQREFKQEFQIGLPPETPAKQTFSDLGWKGFRLRSKDQLHIVQFNRDGFALSRLQPYPHWQYFIDEALRLWQLYVGLAHPSEVQRIGLRFINRLSWPAERLELDDYLQISPQPPLGLDLPFAGFFHQDTLAVPGYSYAINIIKTIQPQQTPDTKDASLIIDIDVFAAERFPIDLAILQQSFEQMRWLKNKAFFGSITKNVLELLK